MGIVWFRKYSNAFYNLLPFCLNFNPINKRGGV